MLKLSSMFVAPLLFVAFIFVATSSAQENPYAIETQVIKNEQAIQNLRQQQASLYLKMEDLLVKYGVIKGKIEDMAHRLDAIEARLNSLASKSGSMQNMSSSKIPTPYTTPQNQTAATGSNIPSLTKQPSNTASQAEKTVEKTNSNAAKNIEKTSQQLPKIKPKKPVVPNDEMVYEAAKKLYDAKRYRAAIEAFSNFKRQYKKSKYLPDAIFYLGQSHFNIGEYDKAIINYDYLINTYPKNKNVPMALLREGISFIKLGDNIDGKYLLEKTISSYPNTKEAIAAKKYLSKIK